MKKYLFITILFLSVQLIFGQVLKGKWVLPTYDEINNDTHATLELSFMDDGTITWEPLPTALSQQANQCEIAAGGYLSNFSLQFYFLDDLFCYPNQILPNFTWNLMGNELIDDFKPEFQVIRKPGTLNHFLAFYTGLKLGYPEFTYTEIEPNGNTWQLTGHNKIYGTVHNTAFGITEEIGGYRYVYATKFAGVYDYDWSSLNRFVIDGQGNINIENIYEVIDADYNSGFAPADFCGNNLEVRTHPDGSNLIAWISSYAGSFDKIFVCKDYNDGQTAPVVYICDLNKGRIGGIEFSDIDPDELYVSCDEEGLIRLDYMTNQIVVDYNPSSTEYGHTFLQKAPDGNIYAVSNSGNTLGRINQTTGQFQDNSFQIPSSVGTGIVSTYRMFGNDKYFILPEESTVYSPLTVTIDPTDVTCPGDNDGSATAIVSGGELPYSYQWYVWNGNSWILMPGYTTQIAENLAAGDYQCCITDALLDQYCSQTTIGIAFPFTHAGGFWIPPLLSYSGQHFTFETGMKINGNKTVTLTNCTFEFAKDAKVIVEQGSTLILNNTTFTSLEECPNMWQGVEVWGTSSKSQFYENNQYWQGTLRLNTGSVIKNAKIAVNLTNPLLSGTNGGIVVAVGADFINNTKSINALPYNNYIPPNITKYTDNLSSFKYCDFFLNAEYMADYEFFKHVDLSQVKGFDFASCNFRLMQVPGVNVWNQAISSSNSGFSVAGTCTSINNPCDSWDYSSFDGFYVAVYAVNTGINTNTFQIQRSNFQNNAYGVSASNVKNAAIIFCDFNLGYSTEEQEACEQLDLITAGRGIDFDHCTGFAIEENHFTKPHNVSGTYLGIRIAETQATDQVYKNYFDHLNYGNYAVGKNWIADYYHGLSYYCNDNTYNYADFYVEPDGDPFKYSGIQSKQGDDNNVAGNKFTSSGATWHFYNGGDYLVGYYFCNYCSNENPDDFKEFQVTDKPKNFDNGCPSHYGGGGGGGTGTDLVLTQSEKQQAETEFATNLTIYSSVKTLYDNLKDGGSTQAALTEIETAWPGEMWELRSKLLGDSPHLSMEVLKATADKTDVLPDNVIFEIMAANPDELKKEELIKYLEDKANPLPEYMVNILRQVAEGSTYKTVLEQEMAHYNQVKTRAAYDIIRSNLNDSVTNMSELRNWLDNVGGKRADEQIIASYMAENNYTDALALATMMPALYDFTGDDLTEHNYYIDMLNLQIQLAQEGRTVYELDSNEVSNLAMIAENSTGVAGAQAKGILEFAYGYHYCNCLNDSDSTGFKSSGMINTEDIAKAYGMEISTEPNPASEWVAFNYTLPYDKSEGTIRIIDAKGTYVTSFDVTGLQGQKVWDTRKLNSGVYFYTLSVGEFTRSGKIVISK